MMRRVRFWTGLVGLFAAPVMALSVELPITDRVQFDLDRGLRDAVVRVAEQMTGMPETQLMTEDPGLFTLPEALVFSYGFTENGFLVDVDDAALITRLAQASIPLWEPPRPATLVWLTEEVGLERRMLWADESALASAFASQFARFDVPLRFVLMDLEDQLALSPAEIWGGFDTAVTGASARYGMDWVMVLGDRPDANETRYWLYRDGQKVMDTVVSGEIDARALQFTQDLLARLRSRSKSVVIEAPAPIEGESPSPLVVRLLEAETVGLLDLLGRLERDPRVIRVAPIVLTGTEASLHVEGALDASALSGLLQSMDGLIEVEPGRYRWQ